MSAEPGAARDAHAHIRGTTEHVVVTAGRWRVGCGDLLPGRDERVVRASARSGRGAGR